MGSKDVLDKFPYFLFTFLKVHMQYFYMDDSETKIGNTTVSCNEILPAI